jgi:curved DNA-binding protein CbpA
MICSRIHFWIAILTILLLASLRDTFSSEVIDLYQLLGVSRQASVKEIKQAYRRKALDTHPDKNTGVPLEEANDAFRQVVRAFEVLSDTNSRQRYDRTGQTDDASGHNNNHYGHHQHRQHHGGGNFHFQWTRTRMVPMKERFDVRQAQSRVIHVISLAQLQTIMLDDNDLLERNLLICITTPRTDVHADDEMVFPYPFAAMSSQNIWWEDLLQTVRIKFYRSSELSRFFNVSMVDVDEKPIFLFGKRGTPLTIETAPKLSRLHTRGREELEAWVWKQIQVRVQFVNRHRYPIEVYWVHQTTANLKATIEPRQSSWHTTMLTHEWYIRDVRVDTYEGARGRYKLTEDSSLGSYKITNDTSPQQIIIKANQCFDLSGHCSFWHMQEDACHTNPNFMNEHCQKTCGTCTKNTEAVEIEYEEEDFVDDEDDDEDNENDGESEDEEDENQDDQDHNEL